MTSDVSIYEKKMFLKLYVSEFWFKMLHVLSFSSSKFEFHNMHYLLSNFLRHMCDVIGVNRSMKQESMKAYVKRLIVANSPV